MSEVPGSSQPRAQAVSSVLYRLLVHKSQLWQYSSMLHVGRFHVPQESHTTHTWRWGQCEEMVLLVPTSHVINLSLFSIKIYFILIKQLSFCLCNLQMPIFIAIPAVRNSASLSWSMIFQLIKLLTQPAPAEEVVGCDWNIELDIQHHLNVVEQSSLFWTSYHDPPACSYLHTVGNSNLVKSCFFVESEC